MKKYILASLALLSCYSASAQSNMVLSGDYVGSDSGAPDGKITVADLTYMTDIILGKKEPIYVSVPTVSTDLQFKRQAFVDETGTFPQFPLTEGQVIDIVGFRNEYLSNFWLSINSVGEDGLSAHSDGGLISLRQDDTKYLVAHENNGASFASGVLRIEYDFSRPQNYNCIEKHIDEGGYFYISQPVSFTDGLACFYQYNLEALVRLSLSGLTPGAKVGHIELESDETIFMSHSYVTVTDEGPQFKPADDPRTDRLYLYTNDCTVDSEGKCEVYMLMGPTDLSSKAFRINAYINDVAFSSEVSGQTMEINHCYTYAASGFAMQGQTINVGENSVCNGCYIFMPAESGIYVFSYEEGTDIYVTGATGSMGHSYQMQAGIPYNVNVYYPNGEEGSTFPLTISKMETEAIVLGADNQVTTDTYYELTIPTSGYYLLTSSRNYNNMRIENSDNIDFSQSDFRYLEAGTIYVSFDETDTVTITPVSNIALGETKSGEENTYYTFTIEEEGYYSITADKDNYIHIYNENGEYAQAYTPKRIYLEPREREYIICVQEEGTLTITKMETPVIALSEDTQVYANQYENREANIYKFVVTESALYHIQTTEGNNVEVFDRGSDKYQSLEPGTYFICFYQGEQDEAKEITVNISKQEVEAVLELDVSNTVKLSTYENPIFYRFQSESDGDYYYLQAGADCDFEIKNWGSERFMSLSNNEYYIRFWSNNGAPSVTTTFTIRKASVVDMPIGEATVVATDKLYRFHPEEDAEYYFSVADGCHIKRVGDWKNMEDKVFSVLRWDEWYLYFYHDTENIASTTAQVKKVEYLNLPYDEETTVKIGSVYYEFIVPENGKYGISVGEGCSFEVEFDSHFISLAPDSYRVRFLNNGNSSLTSTTARVGKIEDVAVAVIPGTEFLATAGMWYKIDLAGEDDYAFISDADWSFDLLDYSDYNPVNNIQHLAEGTYYIRFNKQSEEAPSIANVTIGMIQDVAVAVFPGTEFTATADKWYKLAVSENDLYVFGTDAEWDVEIMGWGHYPMATVHSFSEGDYYIRFVKVYPWSASSAIVTIAKATDLAEPVCLGDEFGADVEKWYKFEVTDVDDYLFKATSNWNAEIKGIGCFNSGTSFSLNEGEYYICFHILDEESAHSATAIIAKAIDLAPEILLGTFTPEDHKIYKLVVDEDDVYRITATGDWVYQISNDYKPEIVSLSRGTYLITFWREGWSSEEGSVTVCPLSDKELRLNRKNSSIESGDQQWYKLTIPSDGVYEFGLPDNWNFEIYGHSDMGYIVALTAGKYYVRFFTSDGSGISNNVHIYELADTESISLGETHVVYDPEQYYTIELPEDAVYQFSVGEGWNCTQYNGEVFLNAGTYVLSFSNYDGIYESADVVIRKAEVPRITIGEEFEVTEPWKYYGMQIDEDDWYQFNLAEEWTYSIPNYYSGDSMLRMANGYYYINFYPAVDSPESAIQVTISKVDRVELLLGNNDTDPNKLYIFHPTEPGLYAVGTTDSYVECMNVQDFDRMNGAQICYFDNDSFAAFVGTGQNIPVTKFEDIPSTSVVLGQELHLISGQLYRIEITEEVRYCMEFGETEESIWVKFITDSNYSFWANSDDSFFVTEGIYYFVADREIDFSISKVVE